MTRNTSFGADVGRDARGRFVRLDTPARPPLHVRLERARVRKQEAPEPVPMAWWSGWSACDLLLAVGFSLMFVVTAVLALTSLLRRVCG